LSGISLGIAVLAQSPASIMVYFYPEHFYLAADEVQSGYAVEIVWYWLSKMDTTGFMPLKPVCNNSSQRLLETDRWVWPAASVDCRRFQWIL